MSADIPLTRQVACAKRELALRKNVYPKWIGTRMTKAKADEEIATMEAIVATLEKCQMLKEVGDHMIAKPKPAQSEFLSQALNEGDGVYRP